VLLDPPQLSKGFPGIGESDAQHEDAEEADWKLEANNNNKIFVNISKD
jgi:hypothetical protein